MALKLKDGADTVGLPAITLAGEQYFVPRLQLRHRIKVQLLLPRLRAISKLAIDAFGIAEGDSKEDRERKIKQAVASGASFELAEDDYLALVDAASQGLLALYPGATREALLSEPIDFEELYAAWPVVVNQAASRRHAAGEALATNNTPGNSGESSSPNSL